MFKKILCALTIYLSVMAGSAWAQCPEGSIQSGDYCYSVSDGEITITGYTGSGGDVIIADTIDGMPVVSIGDFAFRDCESLTSVTIGNNVSSIGNNAFYSCSSLTSVTILNSVRSIGRDSFSFCNSLTSVTIPDSVTSIYNNPFRDCDDLTAIMVNAGNTSYSSQDGILYNQNKKLIVAYPAGKSGGFTIPDSVTFIGNSAFYSCNSLTSVNIPNSVTSIGFAAFVDCSGLTTVTIPDSVTTIGGAAFTECTSLTSVNLPDSITTIEDSVFTYCISLTSVDIPSRVTSIGLAAFNWCTNLTDVTIPDSVTTIGIWAFMHCSSLTSVTIPDSVTSIGQKAFSNSPSLSVAYFLGNAPAMEADVFLDTAPDFIICYTVEAAGFTTPRWEGYPAAPCACTYDSDCDDGLYCTGDPDCVDGACGFTGDPCDNSSLVCDEANNQCVDCLEDTDCAIGYICENDICFPGGFIQIDKCKVKAGKNGKGDSIKFSGLLDATTADFTTADNVIVTIETDDIPNLNTTTFLIVEGSLKKGKYKSPKVKPIDKSDPKTSLKIDTIKRKFKFSAKNVDLTGLSCPITVKIQVGDYIAAFELEEDIVNGTKKPCPPEL